MCDVYIGKSGKKYMLVRPAIGKGNEGLVYKVEGEQYVSKIFNERKRTETKHSKLLAMQKMNLTKAASRRVTWPIDIIYKKAKFQGYVMRHIEKYETLEMICSNRYRLKLYDRLEIAKNLCITLKILHDIGIICGDLNPNNICIDLNNLSIILIDVDSFHLLNLDNNTIYRCTVGMPEYLPREIQNKMKNGNSLSTASLPTFTKETDLFALAIHIFVLVMNGWHPFADLKVQGKDLIQLKDNKLARKQIRDNIYNGIFPYLNSKKRMNDCGKEYYFDNLPDGMQKLFIRAFLKGHSYPAQRPNTLEWFEELDKMQDF